VQNASGGAVFLTADPDMALSALLHNLKHSHTLHERNLIIYVTTATQPFVAESERFAITKISDRFNRIDTCFGYMFGYMEEANLPRALAWARKQGRVKFDVMSTSFFLSRRTFRPVKNQGPPGWQEAICIGLAKSAADATDFYRLPIERVIELGQQIRI